MLAERTAGLIHKTSSNCDMIELKSVNLFSVHILLNQLKITECGMFELNLQTIHTAFTTVLSYVVILIQFELSTHNNEDNKTDI
ncbi:hypothetical protein Bhyg_04490 [Pseudolycoriella hygida]|uniref:Gustatory receptor n=1 Tax=Pseudolycoriella hygida TaxID=35572 RepID=A0A9Q0NFC6_9DIPT|nr:hypothetical protein Bhyg_04490 [Pseudolycoriella hygida]